MSKKLGYVSLGCAKNLVDTEIMLGALKDNGYEITETLDEAEIIIVNTCTFIEKAKQESINTILQMSEYKQFGNCRGLIVAGCLSQQYQEELFAEIPEIDALIGTGSWNRIMEAIEAINDGKRICIMDSITNIYNERMPRMQTTPTYSAYVKIAEGCDNGCTFCIIPKVRGAYRSRTIESIVEEVERLAAMGVKEINLIAQDTTSYGSDLNNGKPMLADLLKALVKVDGIEWYRLLYLYPKYFTDELLNLIVAESKICNYIDLPLQHINDDILRRMNRKDRKADIVTLLQKVRSKASHVTLRTSLIVGFPGETDEQFEELCEFVKEVRFDNMGVFTYSQEDGTPAGAMADQVPEEVKEERYHALMAIQAAISEENNRDLEGTEHEAIIEEISEDEHGHLLAKGRLETQAPDVDGNMYIEDCEGLEVGQIVPVTVAQGFAYDVVAEVRETK
ncbi:30S ribosomal protein S12 methylthiotransferase RimO [Veillonella seminalis]|uniref:Ribosomal protein uS12 methylthiotransferase RimO n=1 Tax=Veillonella seminalis ACS-216-V-Col6b TaxID=883156 RepID=K9D4A8_9FIRM|nr:30S ribosomal protein S12 methylthiotransferase RimO [Veillonella seminalis]EKU79399.1 ribosomal protein S12 methylthiotransferase RimO [Veillonella seminalis ACS-216-V-Col6b]